MAIYSNQNGTLVDLYKVYLFARKVAKEQGIEIPKDAWGTLAKKAHPHYIIDYKDDNGVVVANVNFEYKEGGCYSKCNIRCNSIW